MDAAEGIYIPGMDTESGAKYSDIIGNISRKQTITINVPKSCRVKGNSGPISKQKFIKQLEEERCVMRVPQQ